MKNLLKFLLPNKFIGQILSVKKQARNFLGLTKTYGQWQTIRDWNSVDGQGNPVPWYTYPTTEFLSHLDLTKFNVFEYGSGNSTLWWASRAKQLTSVEDDETWHDRIKNKIRPVLRNINYKLEEEPEKYYTMATNDHDIVIVDGKHRRECLEHLNKTGWGGVMIIFDNADWYPKAVHFIQDNFGWMQVDFHGFGPINDYTWTTTVFINPVRHHELRYATTLKSKCGLVQIASGDY